MEKRKLGKSGLEIAPLVLGGNVFGWTADEPRSFAILDAFVGAGFNMIDTADVYSVWAPGNKGGESETVIGNWLKKRGARDKVLVATKVGYELSPTHKGLKKSYILSEVETSLKRLKTDYIDLYWSHIDDPTTAVDETLSAHDQLVKQGKVRAIGASNFGAPRLKESLDTSRKQGYPRYQGLQPLYNLSDREEFEAELEPLCEKEGLGVLTYFSLASGFLTGKYRSESDLAKSPRGQGVKKYLDARGLRILGALDEVAQAKRATPAQVALAWLMTRPAIAAPIASATSVGQLVELMGSARLALDRESIERLDRASSPRG